MALTLNPATKVFTVPQSDLAFVSGTKWTFDTNVQRKAMMALLASEDYIWMDDAFVHNTEVTVAGVTYARTLEMINSYSVTLEDTGSAYSADFQGSNNNFFDIENSILNPTPLVTVQSNNSAGLQTVTSGSGVTQQDKDDIENQIFDRVIETGYSFEEMQRLLAAHAAGDVDEPVDGTYAIRDINDTKDRISGTETANGGRDVTSVDAT